MEIEKLKNKKLSDFKSIREVIENIGILTDSDAYKRVFNMFATVQEIDEFMDGFFKCFEKGNINYKSKDDFIALLEKYEDKIQKDVYVLQCYKRARAGDTLKIGSGDKSLILYNDINLTDVERKEILRVITSKNCEECLRQFLLNSELDIIDTIVNDGDELKISTFLDNLPPEFITGKSNRFYQKIKQKNKKAKTKYGEIEEKIGLENLIELLAPEYFIPCVRYSELAVAMIDKVYEGTVPNRVDGIIEIDKYPIDKERFMSVLRDNAEYIDYDRLLLIALTNYCTKTIWSEEKDYEEVLKVKEFAGKVENLLIDKNIVLEADTVYIEEVCFKDLLHDINNCTKSFVNGKYYTLDELEKMSANVWDGVIPYDSVGVEFYRNVMKFTKEGFAKIISNSPDALMYFLDNAIIREEDIEKIISCQDGFSDEYISILYANHYIDNEKLIELYMNEKVSIENIKFLLESNRENLESIVSDDKLTKLYENRKDKESIIQWEKYSKLYKTIKIDGKENEEKNDVSQAIIDELNDFNEEALYDLYHMGLVTCDHVIEYIGQDAISLYTSGELKPLDARRLFEEGKIKLEMLEKAFQSADMDDGKKLSLIFSTFSKPEDLEIRNKLLEGLNEVKKGVQIKKETKGVRVPSDEKNPAKERTGMDPCARYNLLANLDNEYSMNYLEDGHAIFYLPNQGKYIIEKLFDEKNRPAYGAATYILDESIYNFNEHKLIEDFKLNRQELTALKGNMGVNKLIHKGKWGDSIYNLFSIDNEEKYTENQRKEIKELIEALEKLSKNERE